MEPTFPCTVESCDEVLATKHLRSTHIYDIHSDVFYISADGDQVSVARVEGGRVQCPIPTCHKVYANRRTFSTHMQRQHNLDAPAGPAPNAPAPVAPAHAPVVAPALVTPASAPALSDVSALVSPHALPVPYFQSNNSNDCEFFIDYLAYPDLLITSSARIFLEPGVDYIVVDPLLDHIGFVLHSLLGILICKLCTCRSLACNARGHFIEHHEGSKYLHGWDNEGFIRFAIEHKLPGQYEDVVHPAPRGPPLQMVKTSVGYACSLSPATCPYATPSLKLMERHTASSDHDEDRRPRKADCHRGDVTLQTVFPWQAKVKWFEVEPALLPPSLLSSSPINFILQNIIPARIPLGPPTKSPSDKERTRFMVFMNWDKRMEAYRTERKMHMQIKTLVQPPLPSSEHPFLKIKPAFQDLMEKASKYFGGGSTQAFAVCKHILHGADISRIP